MRRCCLLLALLALTATRAWAGGGPMNVLVLFNADDPDAVDVANYYAQERSIPLIQLCGVVGVDPTTRTIDFADYETLIHDPLRTCLDGLPQAEEIDYIVVVRGLPYRVNLANGGFYTSLTAMLQIHDAANAGDQTPLAGQPQYEGDYHQASVANPAYLDGYCQGGDLTIENPYSGWYESACGIVRDAEHPHSHRSATAGLSGGIEFQHNLYITTRLDAFDYEDALDLVDRAVDSDGSFPSADIFCMEGGDQARGARDPECEFATRYLAEAGFPGVYYEPFDSALAGQEVAAYFTGTANLKGAIAGNTYVPGAITCNLTSTGAAPSNFFCNAKGDVCPESESQTSIARFVRAGATGAHGTVAEPLNNTFPNAGALLLYTFGYNLGESYFFNERFLYWQNIVLGDPLATPYAERPVVTIPGEVPEGSDLEITASHPDGIAEIRLYRDDALVHAVPGTLLLYPHEAHEGAEMSLLAVAIAEDVEVDRPGWPTESHLAEADVQGWTTATVTVLEPTVGDDDDTADDDDDDAAVDDDDDGDPGNGGCKCTAGGATAPPLAWVALLWIGLLLRRRWRP